MAEWLRPELLDENRLHIRQIVRCLKPVDRKVHRGGMVLKSRPLVTVAGVSQILRQQDGRVVKAPSFLMRTDYIYAE